MRCWYAIRKTAAYICAALCAVAALFTVIPAAAQESQVFTLCVFAYDAAGNKTYIVEETELPLTENLTAFQALKDYCNAHDIEFKYKGEGRNTYVEKVAGYLEGPPPRGWIYHVNDAHMGGSAAGYHLKPGDRLEWFYAVTKEQAGFGSASSTGKTSSKAPSSVSFVSSAPVKSDSSVITSSKPVSSASPAVSSKVPETSHAASQWTPVASEPENLSSGSGEPQQLSDVIRAAGDYLKKHPASWSAFALRAGDIAVPRDMKRSIKQEIAAIGDRTPVTDYQRLYFGAMAADLEQDSLINHALSVDEIRRSTLNAAIFALHIQNARKQKGEALITYILEAQKPDGSFALMDDLPGDIDVTAMAVSALCPSRNPAARAAAKKAVKWLKEQTPQYAESAAQMLLAAYLYGDNALEVQAAALLLTYRNEDGGFAHEAGGDSDSMATEQALIALSAVHFRRNPYLLTAPKAGSPLPFVIGGILALLLIGCAAVILLKKQGRSAEQ